MQSKSHSIFLVAILFCPSLVMAKQGRTFDLNTEDQKTSRHYIIAERRSRSGDLSLTVKKTVLNLWGVDAAESHGTLKASFVKHDGQIVSAVFSWDEKQIVTVTDRGTVFIWKLIPQTLRLAREAVVIKAASHHITSAVFYEHGDAILTTSIDGTISSWNSHTGEHLRNLAKPLRGARFAMPTPDGNFFVTVPSELRLNQGYELRDVNTGRLIQVIRDTPSAVAEKIGTSADGKSILVTFEENKEGAWDIESGKLIDPSVQAAPAREHGQLRENWLTQCLIWAMN